MKTLITVPRDYQGKVLEIPYGVETVKTEAVKSLNNVKEIFIPYSVKEIPIDFGWYSKKLSSIRTEREDIQQELVSNYSLEVKKNKITCRLEIQDYLSRAKDENDAEAQYAMSYFYRYGVPGVIDKNIYSCIDWCGKSGEQGYYPAIMDLLTSFKKGTESYIFWARKAAEAGYANILPEVADMYLTDKYGQKNIPEAIRLYRRAAEAGNATAAGIYGNFCNEGFDGYIKADKKEAVKWWSTAALNGDGQSAYRLGMCYFTGDNAPKDTEIALKYFNNAVKCGYKDAFPAFCYLAEEKAYEAMESKDYMTASGLFGQISDYDPSNLNAHLNASYCYLQREMYSSAKIYVEKALAIDPDNSIASANKKIISNYEELQDKARKYKEDGDRYFNNSNWSKAVESYSKSIALKDNDPYPFYMIARCFYAVDSYDEAIDFCDKALSVRSSYENAKKLKKNIKTVMVLNAISQVSLSLANSMNNIYSTYSRPSNTTMYIQQYAKPSYSPAASKGKSKVCSLCHGTGYNPVKERPAFYTYEAVSDNPPCTVCGDKSNHYHEKCPACNGRGVTPY